jgi:nicotinamidase-related amidase
MAELVIDKQHTALLIGDYYAEVMGTLSHAVNRKCLEKTVALRERVRAAGMLVCYSATVFRPNYPEIHERNKLFAPRKRGKQPAVTNPLDLIHASVKPADGEPVIGKHRVNAFFGTDLSIVLGANNIHTLILLGYATSGVVLSTTRYAADADYRVIVVEDCCADRQAAVHDFLCQQILPFQADVVQSADIISALAAQ